jgi:hypothetical protein
MKTDDLNKSALRALCKTHGVKNYGNLSNDGMRKALAALERFTETPPVKKLKNLDSDPGKPDAATEERIDKAVAKSKGKKPAKKSVSEQPSVKAWLAAQIDKHGEIDVEKAKEWVGSSGRSNVTLYRQSAELGLKLDRKVGVWRRAK